MAKDLGRGHLVTEQRSAASMDIDTKSIRECLDIIHSQDQICVDAVTPVLDRVAQATEFVVEAFRNGGRLIYAGAGTSGRLGVLDASECPPTFGVERTLVQGIIAGGYEALRRAIEGAEDFPEVGAKDVEEVIVPPGLRPEDVVMGIATGTTTPYVHGVLAQAKSKGCKTIFFCCTQEEDIRPEQRANIDVVINPIVGPEVVTGSTRMKAGTATKLVLNMITTTAMIQMGKTYGNIMVDMRAWNEKLVDRAVRIIRTIATEENLDISREAAAALLDKTDWRVKPALIMLLAECSLEEATRHLKSCGGFVRRAIEEIRAERSKA
ncbi:N-acetylmuramic acid 6-phosphate etherase [Candidatus Sumerlaeota bacterium]|nr:N-acetylmuramic acid 6-phosphate etherase [Candidatus Sumerlaeota bacterium]